MPSARAGAAVALREDVLHVLGGQSASGVVSNAYDRWALSTVAFEDEDGGGANCSASASGAGVKPLLIVLAVAFTALAFLLRRSE